MAGHAAGSDVHFERAILRNPDRPMASPASTLLGTVRVWNPSGRRRFVMVTYYKSSTDRQRMCISNLDRKVMSIRAYDFVSRFTVSPSGHILHLDDVDEMTAWPLICYLHNGFYGDLDNVWASPTSLLQHAMLIKLGAKYNIMGLTQVALTHFQREIRSCSGPAQRPIDFLAAVCFVYTELKDDLRFDELLGELLQYCATHWSILSEPGFKALTHDFTGLARMVVLIDRQRYLREQEAAHTRDREPLVSITNIVEPEYPPITKRKPSAPKRFHHHMVYELPLPGPLRRTETFGQCRARNDPDLPYIMYRPVGREIRALIERMLRGRVASDRADMQKGVVPVTSIKLANGKVVRVSYPRYGAPTDWGTGSGLFASSVCNEEDWESSNDSEDFDLVDPDLVDWERLSIEDSDSSEWEVL